MRLRVVLETAATIVVALVWFFGLRPVALGGPASYIVVRGYSMSGALAPGDLVITMAQGSYSVGDAIVYHVPSGAGRGLLVVHRIISADPTGYRMQGDANSYQDPWRPKISNVVGRLVFTMPGFGRVVAWLVNPFVLATVWGLVALIMGLSLLPASAAPKSQSQTTPERRIRRDPGYPSTLDAITAPGVGVMVGLLLLSAVLIVYPAWDVVAIPLSAAGALAALIVGLFCLPDSSIPRPRVLLGHKLPTPGRRGYRALDATAALAVGLMVGLVMVSAGAVLSPAHAAGLTIHSGVVTARVAHCQSPPTLGGMCS